MPASGTVDGRSEVSGFLAVIMMRWAAAGEEGKSEGENEGGRSKEERWSEHVKTKEFSTILLAIYFYTCKLLH